MLWEISLLYFFSWNFIWFLQKEPTTVQNFRLSTAQVKFHQICTLIGYFCWKYIKFQLKKVWRKYVSWCERVVQNLKKNLFHDTRVWCKIWRKTVLWFGKWHEEFGKFSSEHTKFSKLGLPLDLFIQSRKCMSLKLKELCVMAMKNDAKFEVRLTCHFKIDTRNLTNFDPST